MERKIQTHNFRHSNVNTDLIWIQLLQVVRCNQMDPHQQDPIWIQRFFYESDRNSHYFRHIIWFNHLKRTFLTSSSFWTHNTYIKSLTASEWYLQNYSNTDIKQTTTDHTMFQRSTRQTKFSLDQTGPVHIFLPKPTIGNHKKNRTKPILPKELTYQLEFWPQLDKIPLDGRNL